MLPDQELNQRLGKAWEDEKFKALMYGTVQIDQGGEYPSRSEADAALCSKLAFYLGPDPEAIEQVAMVSELNREKWDREDYLRRTIENAIDNTVETYQLPAEKPGTEQQATKARTNNFSLVQAGEMKTTPPSWLVRDYIEADSFALVFGEPGCGKSFFGIDMACSVVTGSDFHDLPVKQSPVVYLAGEGQNGISRRMRAWSIKNDMSLTNVPLYVSTGPASFCDQQGIADVKEAVDQISAHSQNPGLIVIDTLARNFGPGDENATKDMSAFIAAVDELRVRYSCTVLVIHHTGHGNKDRERGSYTLRGAIDANYRLEKNEPGTVQFIPLKMKEAELPNPMAFKLRQMELGFQDEEGKEVTSAVLQKTDDETQNFNKYQGKWQKEAWKILQELYVEEIERLAKEGMDTKHAKVSEEKWRNACMQIMDRRRFSDVRKCLKKKSQVMSMLDCD